MSEEKKAVTYSGVSTIGVLGVLFVGLKLGHIIDWPWLWVTCPFWWWLPLLVVAFLIGILAGLLKLVFG